MKNICILGSTGSIGTQAVDIIKQRPTEFNLIAISANSNIDLLYEQAVELKPKYVVVMNPAGYASLREKLKIYDISVLSGMEGLEYISTLNDVDIVLTSIVGMIGLKPTIAAIRAGKIIALANKETLVVGGELIKRELKQSKSSIIPVDSEHSAIYQCLTGEARENVRKIILTASGGPFRGKKREELNQVTPEEAIRHPRWNMGKKISVDSATLMNKALEVIEAHWLFDMEYDNIDVIVHPQSIIHSMVEYIDGSVIAQIGNTDMRHPIQYAFDYPLRKASSVGYINFLSNNTITFEEPDTDTFECLKLGYRAGKIGGSLTTVLNAANEEAVKLFLEGRIGFLEIPQLIKSTMDEHKVIYEADLEKILEIEIETRKKVNLLVR